MTTPPVVEEPATTPPPDDGLRIERPAGHHWRGVARALARATGTDPTLWRVLFVVLAFFNGLGVVLYLGGLVAIPQEGERRSLAERLLQGPHRRLVGGDLILVIVLVVATVGLFSNGNSLLAIVVLAIVAALVLRHPAEGGYVVAPTAAAPSGAMDDQVWPIVRVNVVKEPKRRSILGRLTASAALLVVSVELLAAALGNDAINERVVLASALAVVGAGLIAGAWWGRSTGLVVLAFLLALGLFASTAVDGVVGKGVGERTWRPVTAGSYELGIGEATLDLRALEHSGVEGTMTAKVGIGHLVVLAPSSRPLSRIVGSFTNSCDRAVFTGDGGTGLFESGGRQSGGVNRHLTMHLSELPDLTLELEVGIGQIDVCHV